MPVTPDGKIIDTSGNPTGQTVDLKTGTVSGAQNIPASQGMAPVNNPSIPASPVATQSTVNPISSPVSSVASIPTVNLQPGTQGPNVTGLQNFLQSLGYLTPQQISTGPGVYGPQTTAAVSKLQQGLGVNPGQYPGYFGPLTRQALQEKYQGAFENLQKKNVPESGAEARAALAEPRQEDPQKTFMDSYFSMNPVVKNLYETLNNTLSSTATKQSFVDEYKQLRQEAGIPGLQTQFLNIKNVMKGTEDDIRNEIMKAGGSATESQVQAMVGNRNRVLLKQANYLSDALQVQNDYVDQVMKFSGVDREQINKQLDRQIGLSEKMASIQNDLNNAARSNYEKIVNNVGYDGLANAIGNNPQQQRNVENLLGLRGGALSDPVWLENAKTFRQQQLGLAQGGMMRAVVDPLTGAITYYYSKPPAGGKVGPVGSGVSGGISTGAGVPISPKAPSWLQSAMETAAGLTYIDATKLKGQAQQYQAQTYAANNNIPFLAPDDAKEVQKANQTYQSAATLIQKIKEYSTKVLTASNSPTAMGAQATKLYTVEHAPILSKDNNAKEYIAARNSLVSLITRAAGEKGTLTDLDVGRIFGALPGYSDNKELAQNKATNLDDVVKSVFQGSINAYIVNSGGKIPAGASSKPQQFRGKDGKIYNLQTDGTYK